MAGAGDVTLQMMQVNKLAEPSTVGRLMNQKKPWHGDEQQNGNSQMEFRRADHAPVAAHDHERNKHQTRQDHADQALGQHRQSHESVGDEDFVSAVFAEKSSRGEVNRQHEPTTKDHVDMGPARFPDHPHRCRQDRRRDETDARVEKIPAEEVCRQNKPDTAQCGRQPHRPLGHAAGDSSKRSAPARKTGLACRCRCRH